MFRALRATRPGCRHAPITSEMPQAGTGGRALRRSTRYPQVKHVMYGATGIARNE